MMHENEFENQKYIEDLAFVIWQYNANETAYDKKLITADMYEFAREKLQKRISNLSHLCYA